MKVLTETEPSKDRLLTLLPETPRELRLWLIDELTVLAEAFGESLTAARLRIYAEDLSDLDQPQLKIALVRARRELKFFPKLSELRELAGAKAEDARKIEAEAAWTVANEYLSKWGVDRMPIYSGGKRSEAPSLPSRIGYALRRIGGLRGLNQMTMESRPFMYKEFAEAYTLAPSAEMLLPQLFETLGPNCALTASAKQLSHQAKMENRKDSAANKPRIRR